MFWPFSSAFGPSVQATPLPSSPFPPLFWAHFSMAFWVLLVAPVGIVSPNDVSSAAQPGFGREKFDFFIILFYL
jgi:hypothetical protein